MLRLRDDSLHVKMQYILNCVTMICCHMLEGRLFTAGSICGRLEAELKDYVNDLRDDEIGKAAWEDAEDDEDE